jgi:hypothetical protein
MDAGTLNAPEQTSRVRVSPNCPTAQPNDMLGEFNANDLFN